MGSLDDIHLSTKRFTDFDLIRCVSRHQPDMRTSEDFDQIQGQDQGHWASEVPKIAFSLSISSAILSLSSKLMVIMTIWDLVYSLSEP